MKRISWFLLVCLLLILPINSYSKDSFISEEGKIKNLINEITKGPSIQASTINPLKKIDVSYFNKKNREEIFNVLKREIKARNKFFDLLGKYGQVDKMPENWRYYNGMEWMHSYKDLCVIVSKFRDKSHLPFMLENCFWEGALSNYGELMVGPVIERVTNENESPFRRSAAVRTLVNFLKSNGKTKSKKIGKAFIKTIVKEKDEGFKKLLLEGLQAFPDEILLETFAELKKETRDSGKDVSEFGRDLNQMRLKILNPLFRSLIRQIEDTREQMPRRVGALNLLNRYAYGAKKSEIFKLTRSLKKKIDNLLKWVVLEEKDLSLKKVAIRIMKTSENREFIPTLDVVAGKDFEGMDEGDVLILKEQAKEAVEKLKQ